MSKALWKCPPRVKIFEALGALADGRIVLHSSSTGGTVKALTTVNGISFAPRQQSTTTVEEDCNGEELLFSCTSSSLDKTYRVRIAPVVSSTSAMPLSSSSSQQQQSRVQSPGQYLVACNDNGSVFQGYLGYPAIGVMLALGVLPIISGGVEHDDPRERLLVTDTVTAAMEALRGVPWKALATKHKNNWDMVVADALSQYVKTESAIARVTAVVDVIVKDLSTMISQQCFLKFSSSPRAASDVTSSSRSVNSKSCEASSKKREREAENE